MNELVNQEEQNKNISIQQDSIFFNVQAFEQAQRVAQMFSKSTFVPETFRNNIGNCIIALETASRLNISPIMLMQRMYIIKGKPAIEGQLAIALVNMSGRFKPLKFKFENKGKIKVSGKEVDNLQCIAYAEEKSSGDVVESVPVSIQMAVDEGWYQKTGSKWQTLPSLMLQYRSGTFFGRVNAPEALAGFMVEGEPEDIGKVLNNEEPDTSNANSGETIDADWSEAEETEEKKVDRQEQDDKTESGFDFPEPEFT